MKKKIFASILSVLLIISIFTGCGAAKNTAADTMAPGAAMEPSRGEDFYYDMDMPEMEATEDGYYDEQNYSTSGGSEDFAYMMNCVQGHGGQATFMRVLGETAGPGHSRTFDFDEALLVNGVRAFAGYVLYGKRDF